jgi:hypothetical protein
MDSFVLTRAGNGRSRRVDDQSSFEREVLGSFSPILLFDFATVFVYGSALQGVVSGYLKEPGLRAEPN